MSVDCLERPLGVHGRGRAASVPLVRSHANAYLQEPPPATGKKPGALAHCVQGQGALKKARGGAQTNSARSSQIYLPTPSTDLISLTLNAVKVRKCLSHAVHASESIRDAAVSMVSNAIITRYAKKHAVDARSPRDGECEALSRS